jgi:protein-L-isoaspartate(D-aspartate) O-methyltransferase
MIDFAVARKKMVENQLRTSSITDHRLLAVMAQIPREAFVPHDRRPFAYIDESHQLSSGGTPAFLSAPAPFGRLVQLAAIGTNDRVLDLGCGTGYSTAVLASLAASVVAVESDNALAASATANLAALGLGNATVTNAPLEAGAAGQGPFDVIVVEGAVEDVPPALFAELAEGGRLVALLRRGPAGVAHIFIKSGSEFASRAEFNTSIPPLATAKPAPEFVF